MVYTFEAPTDMLSFISLYPKGWQQDSYAPSARWSTTLCSECWRTIRISAKSCCALTMITRGGKRWSGSRRSWPGADMTM
ncbi:MAG: hypothetical protein LBU32_06545 [Clostridiales bacterium]|nr:hypothetical protein [Clostridiales bacterium]